MVSIVGSKLFDLLDQLWFAINLYLWSIAMALSKGSSSSQTNALSKPAMKDLETPIGELTKKINPSNATELLEIVTEIKQKKIDQNKKDDAKKSKADLQKKPAKNNPTIDPSGWVNYGDTEDRQINTNDLS